MTADDRSLTERFVDLTVFAPIGFILDYKSVVPELAASARKQMKFSRSLGRAALASVRRQASVEDPGHAGADGSAPAGTVADRSASVSGPTIDGYDGLSARDIVALTAACDEASCRWIIAHERANKQRVTVLRAAQNRLDGLARS